MEELSAVKDLLHQIVQVVLVAGVVGGVLLGLGLARAAGRKPPQR